VRPPVNVNAAHPAEPVSGFILKGARRTFFAAILAGPPFRFTTFEPDAAHAAKTVSRPVLSSAESTDHDNKDSFANTFSNFNSSSRLLNSDDNGSSGAARGKVF